MSSRVYNVIGLMSGTSLDGVDAAILQTDGEEIFGFGPAIERSFAPEVRQQLEQTISAALEWKFNGPPPNQFARTEAIIGAEHSAAINAVMGKSEAPIDLIGFHGQTVLHRAAKDGALGATLQLGDGQALADTHGIPVAFDFRCNDVAAGGQGAPLAPIYHQALCRYSKLTGRIAVVNIGGVSNVTLIDGDAPLRASDCGPGNGPLDSWVAKKAGQAYDKDGALSLSGEIDFRRVDQWLRRDFFTRPMPRSADRYDFDVLADMHDLSAADGAATLASFTAQAIARDLAAFDAQTVIMCGGGRKNPVIMGMLAAHCTGRVISAEAVGWDGDALEAQAFAYLAVRTLRGLPISFPGTTGVGEAMSGGIIANPTKKPR